jgi:HK97 gp10 family phage protein
MGGSAEQRGAVESALKAAAVPVRDKIIENIDKGGHIWTGTLRANISIGKTIGIRKNGYRIKIGVIGNKAPHAHLVENGHGGPHPAPEHPFMAPAYEASKEEAYAIMREQLIAALFEGGGNLTSDVWRPSV